MRPNRNQIRHDTLLWPPGVATVSLMAIGLKTLRDDSASRVMELTIFQIVKLSRRSSVPARDAHAVVLHPLPAHLCSLCYRRLI
ncbi:hypothetical protein BD311DRAFT_388471 [Dichomitus squalens]|uniref:Uncharacterized protein n=1 Tax=Dichomitus squalens TaxID=114155 RepID=A0A4Q9MZS1_9APHY|nr:hypothetical protein BD311DRAFT_388471 [Dichomitus squalens]